MPSSCSTDYALSPTTAKQRQAQQLLVAPIAADEAHDLIYDKYTHHNSPADFRRSSSCSIKWPKAAVLSRLTRRPLRRLLPASSSKRRPCDSYTPTQRQVPTISAGDLSSPSAQPCLLAAGLRLPITTSSITELTSQATSCCTSSGLLNTAESADDVEQLLHILLAPSLSDDITSRTRILTALCTLLRAPSPHVAVQKFVAAGGVETILNILKYSCVAQPSRLSAAPAATIHVEESEKALLLIQISTSYSQDACTAALQHSASVTITLSKKLLRISETFTASAIVVLTSLCCHSDSNAAGLFRQAISKTAIPSKLVVVLQVASKDSTKRRAARLLRLLEEEQFPGRNELFQHCD